MSEYKVGIHVITYCWGHILCSSCQTLENQKPSKCKHLTTQKCVPISLPVSYVKLEYEKATSRFNAARFRYSKLRSNIIDYSFMLQNKTCKYMSTIWCFMSHHLTSQHILINFTYSTMKTTICLLMGKHDKDLFAIVIPCTY